MDELLARKAVVRNDFKALEQFRSFKNAKSVKTDPASDDKELDELKKKYANATWTAEDDKLVNEIRKKMASGVRKPANPAISEIAVLQITIAPDAELGQRELRIAHALRTVQSAGVQRRPIARGFSEKPSKRIAEQKSAIAKTGFVPKNRKAEQEMSVELPAVVNGQILPGEVDRYRFKATKGQRLVIVASARELIPYIPDAVPGWFQATLAVYDSEGKETGVRRRLSDSTRTRFSTTRFPPTANTWWRSKTPSIAGGEDFVYRITIGEIPFITNIFPLGGPAAANTLVKLFGWNLPRNRLTMDDTNRAPGIYPLSVRSDKWSFQQRPLCRQHVARMP